MLYIVGMIFIGVVAHFAASSNIICMHQVESIDLNFFPVKFIAILELNWVIY